MVHLRGMEVLLWVLGQLLKSGHNMLALPCGYADVGRETITAGAALSEHSLEESTVPLAPLSLKLQGH